MLHEGTTDGTAQDGGFGPAVELVPVEVGIDVEFEPGFGDELFDGSREGLAKFLCDRRARGPGLVRSGLGEAPRAVFGVGHQAGFFDIVARPLPWPVPAGSLDMDGGLQPADGAASQAPL